MSKGDKNKPTELDFDTVMKEINKQYGGGIASYASDAKALNISRIPTGSFALDVETGGGLPENRINTIVGPYESAKTTLSLKTVKEAQKKYPDKDVVWVDAEGALDLQWVKKQGLETERMIIIRPLYTEQAFDIILNMVRVPSISLVVLDSLTALTPSREAEESMEDWQMGLSAYLNSKFLRKLSSALWTGKTLKDDNNKCTVLLLNQLRTQVGGYGGGKDILPGGRALDFYAMLRIDLKAGEWRKGTIRGVEEVVGREINFKTEKNRTFPAKKKGSFDLYTQDFGGFRAGGIDRIKEVLVYAVIWDIVQRSGAWYYYTTEQGEEMKFHGNNELVKYFREYPQVVKDIENAVLNKVIESYIEKETAEDSEGNITEV